MTNDLASLRPALCPPRKRLAAFTTEDFVRMIRWHEDQAERAMNSLSCGSENWEYREANRVADAHWCAAALLRLHVGAKE
jgi:hypothetical protein